MALQGAELGPDVPADAAGEGSVEESWQALPLELADLCEAGAACGVLEPVLDLEHRCLVLLAERQPLRRLELEQLERQLHRRAERHRVVHHPPPAPPRPPPPLE